MDWIYYFKNFIVIGRQNSFDTNQSGNFPTVPCTCLFVTDLVGNPEDRFSHYAAHLRVGPYKDADITANTEQSS